MRRTAVALGVVLTATVAAKDIKVGDHIVIHATGKSDHLIASEVKVGAMKMMNDMKMERLRSRNPTNTYGQGES